MAEPVRPRLGVPLTRASVLAAALLFAFVAAASIWFWSQRPRLSEEEVRDVVFSTIQRETPASFLVTGELDVTAVTRVQNTRTLLPGIVGLNLGTTEATVRAPGRVSYGFDVRRLSRDMITVLGDTVVVRVPEPTVYAAEPNLEQLEIETSRGWARLSRDTEHDVRDRAIELVQTTMRTQGEQHLRDSRQPSINTAQALLRLLRPVLEAAGLADIEFRFIIGDDITVSSDPG